jgi:phosphomannomutase
MHQQSATHLAMGMDNRPSSPEIVRACIAATKQLGVNVHFYGVLPTPALALIAMDKGMPAIMVTGSHIPFDRNGLKFYLPDGEISKQDEQSIAQANVDIPEVALAPLPEEDTEAKTHYVNRYIQPFSGILKGKYIGIYEHSSAGRDIYLELFQELGAQVHGLDRSDTFVPVDTESVTKEDVQRARDWQQQFQFDAIFSTDGDGDRPLVFDEKGNFIRGDILGLLAAKHLEIEALAVPVTCNTGIDVHFKKVVRSKIGSPYVISAMDSLREHYKSVAGFEANGGFLLQKDLIYKDAKIDALPTRDAVLPFLALMASCGGTPLSEAVQAVSSRFTSSDRLRDMSHDLSQVILSKIKFTPDMVLKDLGLNGLQVSHIDEIDGLRLTLSDASCIHLRPSGNAPELRCYTEAGSMEDSIRLLTATLAWAQKQAKQLAV